MPGIEARRMDEDEAYDRAVQEEIDTAIDCGYSDLHAILRSGLHCWHQNAKLNPEWKARESKEMDAGAVAHRLLLGKGREIAELDFKDFKTKAAQEARDAAYAAKQIPILARKMPARRKMVDAALAYVAGSEIAGVLDKGIAEHSMFWKENGTPCRGTPDWKNDDLRIVLDYKTTAGSADPDAFVRQIVGAGYDLQAVHYRRGAKAQTLQAHPYRFIWLAQENEAPYACSLIAMDPAMEALAERKWDYAIGLWKHAIKTNVWRGYPSRIAYLEPLGYDAQRFEQLLELGGQA